MANVTLDAVTGGPVDDYCGSPSKSPFDFATFFKAARPKATGEFGLAGAPVCAMKGLHLALPSRWRDDLLLLLRHHMSAARQSVCRPTIHGLQIMIIEKQGIV
jgi:hypothetical protein